MKKKCKLSRLFTFNHETIDASSALSTEFEELRSTSRTYELKFPLCRLSPQKPETTMGKKRSRVAWESLASLAAQWSRARIERERERKGGGKGCAFACRAAVWLRCTPTTRTFCSFVSQPAALGFSAESENGFLPSRSHPRVLTPAPMTTATNFSSTFIRFLFRLKFQLFPPTIVSSSPAGCCRMLLRLSSLHYFYSSTRFPLFITLFKLLDRMDLFVSNSSRKSSSRV